MGIEKGKVIMIDDEEYSSFKFKGDDDDEPVSEQTLYQEESKDRRVEKLSHRVTIISILIPVIIGAVFYITYRDISSRVSQSQDTGAMEIQNLATQLQEKYSTLLAKYDDLETSFAQKLEALEKVDKTIRGNLKEAEDTVNKINATKADKKDQQDAIAKIDTALVPIRKELEALGPLRSDLNAVTAELASLNTNLQPQMAALSANVDKTLKDLTQIRSEISTLSERKLDKDDLELELLKARKSYQRDLDLTKAAIDKRLNSILEKIKDLEKVTRAPVAAPKSAGGAASQGTAGGIVEQEIKE
jgi:DNA repair exonuclease SbcCD ATPase subunit